MPQLVLMACMEAAHNHELTYGTSIGAANVLLCNAGHLEGILPLCHFPCPFQLHGLKTPYGRWRWHLQMILTSTAKREDVRPAKNIQSAESFVEPAVY